MYGVLCAALTIAVGVSCARPAQREAAERAPLAAAAEDERLRAALLRAKIPSDLTKTILAGQAAFLDALAEILREDPYLRVLVDKNHPIEPLKYRPDDLYELTNEGAFRVPRAGLLLRYPAAAALEKMAQAARAEGVTLLASSTWRDYDYQAALYARNVAQNGQKTADRESARPGHSQHQLGLVIDFGSISDAFAETAAGKWMAAHAGEFGWSLSFPPAYEDLTGYRWESWHYRYVGENLVKFIDRWFGGIQQYALQFISEWERYERAS
jgi:D-alanyl-D-alanine carboxypeptidase